MLRALGPLQSTVVQPLALDINYPNSTVKSGKGSCKSDTRSNLKFQNSYGCHRERGGGHIGKQGDWSGLCGPGERLQRLRLVTGEGENGEVCTVII